jgi:hypothetical protein
MSGGSIDDPTLGIAHRDQDGRLILDRVVDQGQRPPFDPRKAVDRFVAVLKEYELRSVTGDRYAGETFRQDFQSKGIAYRLSELTKSEIYEECEPLLTGGQLVLLDHTNLESQFLGLVWRGGKIDHPSGEHDDYANGTAGALWLASKNQVFNPHAVPSGPNAPKNSFSDSRPRGETEIPRTKYPAPIAVGSSGWSLHSRDDDDDYYVGAKPVR